MVRASDIDQSTILVVDDQDINLVVLRAIFGETHRLLAASNGFDALRLAHEERPDVILLDVIMPEMDGLEVCRSLKKSTVTQDIPVIFITSQENPAEETRALEAGAVDFISKPINAAVVKARVKTHLTLKHQADLLRCQALVDGLTGVFNRRRFQESLQYEWQRSARKQLSIGLFMIDVDNFKRLNDTWGHQAGDTVLVKLARTLKTGLKRSQDLLARYGGEEFVCLVPEATVSTAQLLAQQLVQSVAETKFEIDGSREPLSVTISLGFAVTIPQVGVQPTQFLGAADASLYKAKESGKNQAVGQLWSAA